MMKFFKFSLLAMSFVLCLSALTFAQRTTGDLEGTVKDQKGAVVPGVSVTVTGVSVGFTRTVVTNSDGVYRVSQLPAGSYKIATAALSGFSATTLDNVTVNIEKVTTSDIELGVSSAVNTVEIAGDPLGVAVDTTSNTVQTNITTELINQLPKGGSFTSLLKASPGTRAEPLSGGFQVDGASGSENSFVIDCQPLENYRTGTLNGNNNVPTSLVAEVQIKTGGFEASYGGASGAVISVQTKSGSDKWHGEFGSVFESNELQPGPRFTQSSFVSTSSSAATIAANPDFNYSIKQNRDQGLNTYPTASLGGPIIKERLWFYGNYSPQIFSTTRTSNFYNTLSNSSFANGPVALTRRLDSVTGNPIDPIKYTSTQKNEYAFGRLDSQIMNNLRVTGTYLWNPIITHGTLPFASITTSNPTNIVLGTQSIPSGQYYPLTGGRQTSDNLTGQAVYTPTSKLVIAFHYGRAFLNEKPTNYAIANATRFRCQGSSSAYSIVSTNCPGGIGYQNLSSNSPVTREVSRKDQYDTDVSYLVGNLGGSHEFKGGYQYGKTSNDTLTGNAKTGVVNLYYGATFSQLGSSSIGAFVGSETGGTGISSCPTVNTTTCLGVGTLYRFGTSGIASNKYQAIYFQDKWQPSRRLTLNLGVRAEKENLPAYNTGAGIGGVALDFGWGKKIAPRLGGSYDIFGDGKTKIYASYGWFYDRLKFELPRGSFGGNFYRVDFFRITSAHPNFDYYTPSVVLGNFTDPIGGGVPSSAGGLSEFQTDLRIPSNLSAAQKTALGLCATCGVADDIKPFRQSEFTVGFQRELSRDYVLSTRYTRKNVDHTVEDHAVIGLNLSENYYIGNPGEGSDLAADQAAGYSKSAKAQRLYNGLEIVLEKRLSHHFFFNANYTLSHLYGNYSGLASSDEAGRTAPGVDRFFDYIINGFTATGDPDNGDLATDRRHTFKSFGGYEWDWWGNKTNSTELSYFQYILQGTPQTTFVTVVATAIPLSKRGDLGRTPTFWQTDLSMKHKYRFGNDGRFVANFNIDLINAFNNNSVLTLNTTKYRVTNTIATTDIDPSFNSAVSTPTAILNKVLNGGIATQIQQLQNGGLPSLTGRPNPVLSTYGLPSAYQAPRLVRFGFGLTF